MKIEFIDSGREPQCAPDPSYPDGIALVDLSEGVTLTCTAELPYPAPRIGLMEVECERCGLRVAVTVAGRPDDPRSVKLGCRMPLQ